MSRLARLAARFSAAVDGLNRVVGAGVAWLALVMVLVGAANALLRHGGRFLGTDLSSNAFIEAQWYAFSVLFLLAGADVLRRDRHVRVDVLHGRLGPRARAAIDLVGTLVFLLPTCVVALAVSWPSVRNSFAVKEISPDPNGLPRYPIKAVVLVAFVLLFLQGVSEALKRWHEIRAARNGETEKP